MVVKAKKDGIVEKVHTMKIANSFKLRLSTTE